MNPDKEKYSELPLKRFYRYVMQTNLHFDSNGLLQKSGVTFRGIPEDPLLTLGVDVPQAWVVMPIESIHDLDNLRLKDLDSATQSAGVHASFQLRYLLVEGHARDLRLHAPPRGLQFLLGTLDAPLADTIVMANLGYFQLKANPGVWNLRIREGRSREFYDLTDVSNGAMTRQAVDGSVEVIIDRFDGVTLFPRVSNLMYFASY